VPSLDSMLDMYLAGARDTAKELITRLKQTSLPPGWVQQQEEEIIGKLVALRFGAGRPLVIVVNHDGFRWSYRSVFQGKLRTVTLAAQDERTYRVAEAKYGVLVMGNALLLEPRVYQEF